MESGIEKLPEKKILQKALMEKRAAAIMIKKVIAHIPCTLKYNCMSNRTFKKTNLQSNDR